MAEKNPQVNTSLENIRRDLEVLRNAGALRPEQYASITAQLPVCFSPHPLFFLPASPYRKGPAFATTVQFRELNG